jgi:hypothetical protein
MEGITMRELSAVVEVARQINGTIFKYLDKGARFRFPKSETVYVKTGNNGWYKDEKTGQKFRTGVLSGVLRA